MKKPNNQTKAGRKKQKIKPPKPDRKKKHIQTKLEKEKTINKTQLDRKKMNKQTGQAGRKQKK